LQDGPSEARSRRTGLEIVLAAFGFGLANLVVAVLNGISLSRAPMAVPMGFVAGLGVGLALIGHGGRRSFGAARVIAAGLLFGAVQALFLALPQSGSGISIALSGGFFQVEFNHFTAAFWQRWMAQTGSWFKILSFTEALLSGMALLAGARLGLRGAASFYDRWRNLLERLGD